jgi:hypothetical protein
MLNKLKEKAQPKLQTVLRTWQINRKLDDKE